jgi:glutathione synthase/RimK-type ligase-like ATP-grasp enzyme
MSSQVWKAATSDLPASESKFAEQVSEHDILVQEFIPEIETSERSMVFFSGEYSHAWNSIPAEDDVTSFEGSDPDYEPTALIREQGTDVIQAACDSLEIEPEKLAYARVDYVPRGDELVLMELELIEPYVGFERGKNTVERFAQTLVSYFETTA